MYTLEDFDDWRLDGDVSVLGTVTLTFDVRWGHPGRTSGPADQCYPPEGDEVIDLRSVCTYAQFGNCEPLTHSGLVSPLPHPGDTMSLRLAQYLGETILESDREHIEAVCLEHARSLEPSGAIER